MGAVRAPKDLPDAPSIPSHWDPKHRPCPSRSRGKSEVPTWRGVSARGWVWVSPAMVEDPARRGNVRCSQEIAKDHANTGEMGQRGGWGELRG